ncbi:MULTISPECIES: hypothetical protein [Streptomyces]|uniref:Uncharacterized protein n=1 Tax=Streptomyces spororaveus TaxID=284039 RepID=A0ABQ3T3G5_9ACTN|nr:hypothetical protein [Streptomyces spororaveus]MCM9077191.1 hypothetical protein [Streptomyces spororaveus]GHI74931.1 hypothetical protein Sspor_04920 [Streptomyces spororaveus]
MGAAAWFNAAQESGTTTDALCGPNLGRDEAVAAQPKAVAFVEAVEKA